MGEKKRRMEARVTISDVAQKAGVSRTAVSFVLNEHGTRNRYVSEETRARVWQAVQDLQYQPDLLARTLRTGRSMEIAGIIDTTQTPLGAEVSLALQQRALQYGYMPTTYFSQGLSQEQRQRLYQQIFARRPLAIVTTPEHFTAGDVERAREHGVASFLFYSFAPVPIEQTYSLIIPTRELGYLAATHLLERGHRHLAIIQPADPSYEIQEEPFQQRLAGMRAAIAGHPDSARIVLDIFPLHLSASTVMSLVQTHLREHDRATGIYAFNDEYAFYLLGALASEGIHVPRDLAILGTDNLSFCEGTWPPLTSISLDGTGMGIRGADLLHTLYQGQAPSEEQTRPLLPLLIQRAST